MTHAASANWPSRSPWTTQISVLDADGNAASLTCSTGCGSGVVVPGTGVHLNNMLGETDLNVGLAQARAGHAADEHDGAVARARATGGRARRRLVGLGSHPLGDRAGGRRGARPRAAAAGGGRACARASRGRRPRLRGRHPGARSTRSRRPASRIVRWPGRNIYFGGAQVVARTPTGSRRPATRAAAARASSSAPEGRGGERTADHLRSRGDDRTRLFEHPCVRSTLQTLRLDPRPAVIGFRA